MVLLETRTEALSGCRYGEATAITGTAWNTPTAIHDITVSGVIDAVFLQIFNTHTATVDINLIMNPDDSGTMASVDASTATIVIGAENSVWVLLGNRFRMHGDVNNTLTIGAWVTPTASGRLLFQGHVDRLEQPEENPL